jgi:hypothetical protein
MRIALHRMVWYACGCLVGRVIDNDAAAQLDASEFKQLCMDCKIKEMTKRVKKKTTP